MKYVKKWNMGMIVATMLSIGQSDASNVTNKHEIIKHSADEIKDKAFRDGFVHAGVAAWCTVESIWSWTVAGQSPCVLGAGLANLQNNEFSKSTLKKTIASVEEEKRKEAEASIGQNTGIHEKSYLDSLQAGMENQIGGFLTTGAAKAAKEGSKQTTKEIANETLNESLESSGGYAGMASNLLLPSEREVMTLRDSFKKVMAITDKGSGFIPESAMRAARQGLLSASEFMVKAEWEEIKKNEEKTISELGDNSGDISPDLKNETPFDPNKNLLRTQNNSVAKSDSNDPCANVTNASAAVSCISSKNAAIKRALNDPRLAQDFRNKTGKDLKESVGNMALQYANDPASAIRGIGNALAAGGMSGDQLNRANQFLGGLSDQLKSTIEEEQSKIASSKMSDKYKTTNQVAGGAGKGAGTTGAGMPNLDMANMFGDLFGKKPGDKKEAGLGKLNFAAARKEKIPGYGADVWENRQISIFERVENAYQDVTLAQGFDWSSWKLSSNQKAAGSNAKGRMPASSQR